MTSSDEELLILLRREENKKHAFDEIYFRYFPLLHKYAYNILRDTEECNDVLQEIFLWLWKNRKVLEINNLKSYLISAVKFNLARRITTSKNHNEIISRLPPVNPQTDFNSILEVKELRKIINDFIDTLPPRSRHIFILSREKNISNREIARVMNISEKTVENQITIVLRKLRFNLKKLLLSILSL